MGFGLPWGVPNERANGKVSANFCRHFARRALGLELALRDSLRRAPSLHRPSPPKPQTSPDAAPQPPSAPAAAAPVPAPAPANSDAEMTTQETSVPLRVLVNLVPVRVIVRDSKGHAVATLHKEDFQLFQDGKPQIISNFSVETPAAAAHPVVPVPAAPSVAPNPGALAPPAFLPPTRFVALLFDDALLNQQDLMQARNAASKYLDTSVKPTDRVAIVHRLGPQSGGLLPTTSPSCTRRCVTCRLTPSPRALRPRPIARRWILTKPI